MNNSASKKIFSIFIPKLFDLVKRSAASRGIAIGKIADVPEYRMVTQSMRRRNVNLVLDLGANRGQFAKGIRAAGYTNKIFSYEPAPDVFRLLERAKKGDMEWEVYNLAVIDTDEKSIQLNVTSNMGYSSSILNFSPSGNDIYPEIQMLYSIDVPCKTLIKILREISAEARIYIKADIQGFEGKLFRAFDLQSDKRIEGVMIEISLIEIYDGEWGILEAINYFEKMGFALVGVTPEDYDESFGHPQVNLYFEKRSN